MFRDEGINLKVYENSDVKCAVVERAHRTIRDRIYKYFINIPTDIETFCRNLSKSSMTRFTRPKSWRLRQ